MRVVPGSSLLATGTTTATTSRGSGPVYLCHPHHHLCSSRHRAISETIQIIQTAAVIVGLQYIWKKAAGGGAVVAQWGGCAVRADSRGHWREGAAVVGGSRSMAVQPCTSWPTTSPASCSCPCHHHLAAPASPWGAPAPGPPPSDPELCRGGQCNQTMPNKSQLVKMISRQSVELF